MKLNPFGKKELSSPGTVIPDHAKKNQLEEQSEIAFENEEPYAPAQEEKTFDKGKYKNLFRVNGMYDVGDAIMISGVVESGRIAKNMKAKKDKKEIEIKEIRINSDKMKELNEGEEGTIFVKSKQMPNVKYDNLLEFK